MPDKKRGITLNKKTDLLKTEYSTAHRLQTFDDILDMQMDETIAAVVKKETYPRDTAVDSNSIMEYDEEQNEYQPPKDGQRFSESPHTVAQNYIDRVQFRR